MECIIDSSSVSASQQKLVVYLGCTTASSKLTCSAILDMLVLVLRLKIGLSGPLHFSFDLIKPLQCQTLKKRRRFE